MCNGSRSSVSGSRSQPRAVGASYGLPMDKRSSIRGHVAVVHRMRWRSSPSTRGHPYPWNHPNIGHIYGLEEAEGQKALVLELVEGPTLADRIKQGPIPVDEALPIAKQIAEALEAAHEQGIIHRDLKPANVKVKDDGTVKVLDFGLAKALEPAPEGDPSQWPTVTAAATASGVILGTAAYMSPEQAKGRPVDKRGDIWSFGCVVYEMLAGGRAFDGAGLTEVLAQVIERQPDWSALPISTPPHIRRVLMRCLEKDPRRRLRDIGDAWAEIEVEASPATTGAAEVPIRPEPRRVSAVAPALLLAAVAGGLGWCLGGARSTPQPARVSRLLVDVRPAEALLGSTPGERALYARSRPSRTAIALSPDGRMLAFTARRGERQSLYLRSLEENEAVEVSGTEGAEGPFFSPDGGSVGFWADGALWRVSRDGGPAVKITDTSRVWGTSWTEDDRIVFAQQTVIWSVDPDVGEPTALTTLSTGDEVRHVLPQAFPGGRWLLYTVLLVHFGLDQAFVVAQSLATGERKTLIEVGADARYLPTGHLVYMRLGDLMAAPFDAEAAELIGGEAGIVEDILQAVNMTATPIDTGAGQYTVSSDGTLAYVAGDVLSDIESTLLWVHRDGSTEEIPVPPPPRPFFSPRLSPDGQRLAVGTLGLHDHSIFRYDFATGALTRLTLSGWAALPLWTNDGSRLAINFAETGPRNLFSLSADGGQPERLARAPAQRAPSAWTPDGRSLVFSSGGDIHVWSPDTDPQVRPLLNTSFPARHADLSPDGRWLAYVSDETGRPEVYVVVFPGLGGKRTISTRGGVEPAWSADGRTLAFLEPLAEEGRGYRLLSVAVTIGDEFSYGPVRHLFDIPWYSGSGGRRAYDLTGDAERFLFVRETYPAAVAELDRIHIVENWDQELLERVPVD